MSTVAFVLMLTTLKLLLFLMIRCTVNICPRLKGPRARSISTYLYNSLFFAEWIIITIETYMEFLIAGFLAMRKHYTEFYGDCLSLSYAGISLALAFIFLPGLICRLSRKRY